MNHLCDKPATEIVESESNVRPVWYSRGGEAADFSFNSIKRILETSDRILTDEIEFAKRSGERTKIGRLISP